MKSKDILLGAVMSAVVSTSYASQLSNTNDININKQAQAKEIMGVFGSVVQNINSPECSVRPKPVRV